MSQARIALLAAVAAAGALAAGSAADSPIFSTTVFFRVTESAQCTISAAIDGGATMQSSGAVVSIPPGPYQVSIRTPLPDDTFDTSACEYGRFSFTGPGVSFSSTFGVNGLPPYSATINVTLAPSATYTMVDASRPSSPLVFTTTATGSSSSLVPTAPASTAKSTGSIQPSLVGSEAGPALVTLMATVPAAGKPTLESSHGKPLVSLKAGRYAVVVQDASRSKGLMIERAHGKPTTLASAAFTGKRTVRVTLSAGHWTYFSAAGTATPFVVTAR